jgi:predicted amidophosphoribosyltransferase
MTTMYVIGMTLLVLLPLALMLWALLRYYRFVSRPATEEELQIARDFTVCPNCGTGLEKRTPHCPECGMKLQAEPETRTAVNERTNGHA